VTAILHDTPNLSADKVFMLYLCFDDQMTYINWNHLRMKKKIM
jgi:hypothetical protein